MSLGRADETISLGSHVMPFQEGFSQRIVCANFMTNGVPFLWHVIYSNRPMRREPSDDILILYHVVSETTNSIGQVVAIEFRNANSSNLKTCQLRSLIPCTTEFEKRKDRWQGPKWQFLKREITPQGLQVLDYYEGKELLSTIITTTNDVIRDIVFSKMRAATSQVSVTDFSQIAFFDCCPLVSTTRCSPSSRTRCGAMSAVGSGSRPSQTPAAARCAPSPTATMLSTVRPLAKN